MYFSKSMAPLHTAVNFATLNYLFSHYYASYYAILTVMILQNLLIKANAITLDFGKAFGWLPHECLLTKLKLHNYIIVDQTPINFN